MADRYSVHLYWRMGMNPVDICVYVAFTHEAAFAFAHSLSFECNKKRGWFVKEWGSKRRQYQPPEPPPPSPEPNEVEAQQLPLLEPFTSVWQKNLKGKRRL